MFMRALLLLMLSFTAVATAPAAQAGKIGPEFRVNTRLGGIGTQLSYPRVAALTDGGFVAVWLVTNWSFDGTWIHGRIFEASGQDRGSEFRIASAFGASALGAPIVTALEGGGFVVVWGAYRDVPAGLIYSPRGQVFSDTGARIGAKFVVAPGDILAQRPTVASLRDGRFVVVWHTINEDSIGNQSTLRKGQIRTEKGPTADPIIIHKTLGASIDLERAAVTGLADGGFVVAYTAQQWQRHSMFVRSFDPSGMPYSNPIPIKGHARWRDQKPALAASVDGGFVLVWNRLAVIKSMVLGLRFLASGHRDSPLLVLEPSIAANSSQHAMAKERVSVIGLPDDGFIAHWDEFSNAFGFPGCSASIAARHYTAADVAGTKRNDIAAWSTCVAPAPATALLKDGTYVVIWTHELRSMPSNILGQRFRP